MMSKQETHYSVFHIPYSVFHYFNAHESSKDCQRFLQQTTTRYQRRRSCLISKSDTAWKYSKVFIARRMKWQRNVQNLLHDHHLSQFRNLGKKSLSSTSKKTHDDGVFLSIHQSTQIVLEEVWSRDKSFFFPQTRSIKGDCNCNTTPLRRNIRRQTKRRVSCSSIRKHSIIRSESE